MFQDAVDAFRYSENLVKPSGLGRRVKKFSSKPIIHSWFAISVQCMSAVYHTVYKVLPFSGVHIMAKLAFLVTKGRLEKTTSPVDSLFTHCLLIVSSVCHRCIYRLEVITPFWCSYNGGIAFPVARDIWRENYAISR